MVRKSKSAAVIYIKTFLTGMSAGKSFVEYVVCNSRKSAADHAAYLRGAKVMATELTEDLYKVSKVKTVSFTGAYGFDVLKAYKW